MCDKVADGHRGSLAQSRTGMAEKDKECGGGLLLEIGCGEDISESEENLAQNIQSIHLSVVARV